MTQLPDRPPGSVALGLVIDLDICVGCHACAVACKAWNDPGDADPYGASPLGAWLNRIHSFEIVPETGPARIVHFPKSCLHCEDAPCVTVCPTGASWKRAEDGIVLVEDSLCMGCGLCAWACPYGAREIDPLEGVMRKCTLCVDRIDDGALPEADRVPACVRACPTGARAFGNLADPDSAVSRQVADRGGYALMPEQETRPVNQYLPPRPRDAAAVAAPGAPAPVAAAGPAAPGGLLGWLDRALARIDAPDGDPSP